MYTYIARISTKKDCSDAGWQTTPAPNTRNPRTEYLPNVFEYSLAIIWQRHTYMILCTSCQTAKTGAPATRPLATTTLTNTTLYTYQVSTLCYNEPLNRFYWLKWVGDCNISLQGDKSDTSSSGSKGPHLCVNLCVSKSATKNITCSLTRQDWSFRLTSGDSLDVYVPATLLRPSRSLPSFVEIRSDRSFRVPMRNGFEACNELLWVARSRAMVW